MSKKMLIDGTNTEEKRVVVIDGEKLEEFEVETSTRKQNKGNVYLAKITRIEPSLQAAFVDYGEERHGFLAFNEIHPSYFQIPQEEKEEIANQKNTEEVTQNKYEPDEVNISEPMFETSPEEFDELNDADDDLISHEAPSIDTENISDEADDVDFEEEIESRSGRSLHSDIRRKYKIQDVLKKNQVVLIQIVKEERGNKGAALTTYLSLAGRYCVLMPNTANAGGVSRKIVNPADRHRLKDIVKEFPEVEDMSVIVRTAGKERTKQEIVRDYDYLTKTWNKIRETTLKSNAPKLIHEEGNLIKRSIRDIYSRDIDEIVIAGEESYKDAKEFMKVLTPSHAKKVRLFKDEAVSLFQYYGVEEKIEQLHSSNVELPSGGYLVINPTEALVAIDVNSGKATKEKNIEETALKTNLEAADEIARQLRLRNLAGLIVIDFIDMEETVHNHMVEKRMKEALKKDRSRIQMARISGFGLMELSRQRTFSSFLEMSYHTCPYCKGKGVIRSFQSSACYYLRLIEEEIIPDVTKEIIIKVPEEEAFYLLNNKRETLSALEIKYNVQIIVEPDDNVKNFADYKIEVILNENAKNYKDKRKQNKQGLKKNYKGDKIKSNQEVSSEIADEIIIQENFAPEDNVQYDNIEEIAEPELMRYDGKRKKNRGQNKNIRRKNTDKADKKDKREIKEVQPEVKQDLSEKSAPVKSSGSQNPPANLKKKKKSWLQKLME